MTEVWMPDDYVTARRKWFIKIGSGAELIDIDPSKEDHVRGEFGSDKNGMFYGSKKK